MDQGLMLQMMDIMHREGEGHTHTHTHTHISVEGQRGHQVKKQTDNPRHI